MRAIIPPGTATPIAPFSPGAMAGGALYVSGTLAFDALNQIVHPAEAAAQTRHVLETIKRVIQAAGGSMADVTRAIASNAAWSNPRLGSRSLRSPISVFRRLRDT